MTYSRILFIDFDGVLHPKGGPPGNVLPFEWLPHLVRVLDKVQDVGVVVHSSWREQWSADYIAEFMEAFGGQFVGVTSNGSKAESIQQFLMEHPQVVEALIVDDEPLLFWGIPGVRVLACDPLKGVSCPNVQKELRDWLSRWPEAL